MRADVCVPASAAAKQANGDATAADCGCGASVGKHAAIAQQALHRRRKRGGRSPADKKPRVRREKRAIGRRSLRRKSDAALRQ